MGKQRYIDTKLWSDSYVSKLDPVEKLLFIYLMTNERTNLAGIYELPDKYMAVETGIENSMLQNILSRFERDGKITLFEGWVCLVNAIKHQNTNNTKIKSGIDNIIENVPLKIKQGLKLIPDDSSMTHTYPMDDQSHLIELNRIELNKIESNNLGASAKAVKKEKPSEPVSIRYFEVIKELKLPTRNFNNLRSYIDRMYRELGVDDSLQYLDFVSAQYPILPDDGFKPKINDGIEIYTKRQNIQSWIERVIASRNRPATAGGRPVV